MKTWALVVDTWREAYARYTLLGFLGVSLLFLLVLTFSLNLDIVDGTLAAGTLFGKSLELGGKAPPIETVVGGGLAMFAGCSTASGCSWRCSPPAPRCRTWSAGALSTST